MHSVIKGITTKIVKIMSIFIFQEKREPTEVKHYIVDPPSIRGWSIEPLPLPECAAKFDTFLLQEVRKNDATTYEKVKAVYRDAINDGVYEVANNLGILLADYEGKIEEGLRLMNLASDHGSANASANMFTLLWEQDYYDQAIDVLQREYGKKSPSLQCLWNYAVLSLRLNIPNNTVLRDEEKAYELFERIANTQDFEDEEGGRVIENSKKCVGWMKDTNEYGRIGQEFHGYIGKIQPTDRFKDYYKEEVCKILTGLDFDGNLKVHFAEMRGSGDEFWFYVDNGSEDAPVNRNSILSHIKAAPSELNAWCVYLLMTSTAKMPTFWHGGYIARVFIFAKSDLRRIKELQNRELSVILDKTDVLPDVQLTQNEAVVTCCYWNDWEGLVKETAKVTFGKSNNVEMYSIENTEMIYKYNCGVCF